MMTEEELNEIIRSVCIDPMYDDSYMCLKEDFCEDGYAEWGWNKSLEKMIINFSYAFVLLNIMCYNDNEKLNIINDELVMELINKNDDINIDKLSKEEKRFVELWKFCLDSYDFESFKENSKDVCDYLTSLGYILNYYLFENPRAALDTALEFDKYLPDGEPGIGEFLKEAICDEYDEIEL